MFEVHERVGGRERIGDSVWVVLYQAELAPVRNSLR
jgi:hypothetical protein